MAKPERLSPQKSVGLVSQCSESIPLLQTVESRLLIDAIADNTAASPRKCHCKCEGGKAIGTCRICFEQETNDSQDPHNPLICPCKCSGSSKYVHRSCLQQWREKNHRADAYYSCEVCKYRYRYRRLWWGEVLKSQTTLTVIFLLALAACIALLGFVPIMNGFFNNNNNSGNSSSSSRAGRAAAGSSSSSSRMGSSAEVNPVALHIINGVVLMALMGLLLSLMVHVGRAIGLPALALLPDPWCPSCVWCMDAQGNGGLSWSQLVECGQSGGECGVALLVLVTTGMLILGIVLAAYMLYAVVWMLVQAGLLQAQRMVENVQQEKEKEKSSS